MRHESARLTAPCPQCGGVLTSIPHEWWHCSQDGCPYEINGDAHGLYVRLSEAFEADPDGFFTMVRAHRDEVRALDPVWVR
ncbi:hypothetical protein [Streptomyces sp. NPDC048650]|uniref:hypothetical protein n=1 Tax=unclassified Streptomyces TaxID=2593676 RepID=UPI003710CF57